MVIFHSYVSLPEGIYHEDLIGKPAVLQPGLFEFFFRGIKNIDWIVSLQAPTTWNMIL